MMKVSLAVVLDKETVLGCSNCKVADVNMYALLRVNQGLNTLCRK